MKNRLFIYLLISVGILCVTPVSARSHATIQNEDNSDQDKAQALLKRVAEYITGMGRYRASFDISSEDYNAAGYYTVDGNTYYINVDKAEVYSDGKVRYEVDNSRKEINVDVIDTSSRNILDNPTHCFDFVGTDYISEIVESDNGKNDSITLRTHAADPKIEGEIYLTVDRRSARPLNIRYTLYDQTITVRITDISSIKTEVKIFDNKKYVAYELIDFR